MAKLLGFGRKEILLSARAEKFLQSMFVAGVLMVMLPKLVLAGIRKAGTYVFIFLAGSILAMIESRLPADLDED